MTSMTVLRRTIGTALLPIVLWGQSFSGSLPLAVDGEPINYAAASRDDAIAKLNASLQRGEVEWEADARYGLLPGLLKSLGIPLSSQVLVFSKTSFQLQRISPEAPRALYFNDDVYVGWVQGSRVLEVSAVDPRRGGIFYTLAHVPGEKPQLRRRDDCLQCHASANTLGVPGHIVRSVYPDAQGYPLTNIGSFLTTHRSPYRERWGGWYVHGELGRMQHMGNAAAPDGNQPDRLTPLARQPDLTAYLTPHSDVVALLVLEHQTAMHNVIARAGMETRLALYTEADINRSFGRPPEALSDSTRRRIANAAEVVVRDLFFSGEPALPGEIRGPSEFRNEFSRRGPRDRKGRGLREFDLRARLFRYPLSYLIYSAAFDDLPPLLLNRVYDRIDQVLNGEDTSAAFAHLSAADRSAIREIVLETKPAYRQRKQPPPGIALYHGRHAEPNPAGLLRPVALGRQHRTQR